MYERSVIHSSAPTGVLLYVAHACTFNLPLYSICMKPEQLPTLVPQAQESIVAKNSFEQGVEGLNEPIKNLEDRLLSIKESLRDLEVILYSAKQSPLTIPVAIRAIDTEPSGHVYAQIVSKLRNSRLRVATQSGTVDASKYDYSVCFYFETSGDTSQDKKREDLDHVEQTRDTLCEDNSEYVSGAKGVAHPPTEYSSENAARLERYRKDYLPSRRQQIEDLENTIRWIKAALEDETLNPWYKEHLAQLEERRREEADAAQRRANEVVLRQSLQPQPVTGRRRRFPRISGR
jgi:hypothetical protein